jgi:excinuclease ABC subunit C
MEQNNNNLSLEEKLESLPALPGVYQLKDKNDKIIYIGKAKNLRSRVRSYFHASVDSPKTLALVKKVEDFQLIVTDSEVEALVLENNLIKEHKPRYNINLKDDKSFPYIRVTNEPYPQVVATREIIHDGSKYFGPYTDVKNMRTSLRMINQIFKIRSCKYFIDEEVIKKKKIKVCLDYHIKKCDGPCEGLISQFDYGKMVGNVIKLLRGKTDDLLKEMTEEMHELSANFEFEKAAELRDKIERLKIYSNKQKIVSTDFEDKDIISAAVEGKDVATTILNIREGRLVGKRQFQLSSADEELKVFMLQ